MIGLLLLLAPIFFIWRYYAELAFEYEKPRTGFAFLGIGVYIVSYFVLGILVAVVMLLAGADPSLGMDLLVNALSIALGALVAWLVFFLLKRSWKKQAAEKGKGLLDN